MFDIFEVSADRIVGDHGFDICAFSSAWFKFHFLFMVSPSEKVFENCLFGCRLVGNLV